MASVMPRRTTTDAPWDAISTSHLLHRAQQLASDRFSYLLGEDGEDGVTLRQFVLLTAIAETPGASQTDLVRATGIDRSTLTDLVQRLDRNGWVARKESDSDARANVLELTPSGMEKLVKARKYARAADAAILDALPASKRAPFQNMLLRLAKYADKLAREAEQEAKREAKRDAKLRAKERKKAKAQAEKQTPPSNDNPPRKRKSRKRALEA